jgi:ribosomal protein S13
MTDLQTRINAIIQILANDLPKADKVVASLKAFSGLDITHFNSHQNESINKYLTKINNITARYPIKTDDDYKILSNADLSKILKSVQKLCLNLLVDLKLEYKI